MSDMDYIADAFRFWRHALIQSPMIMTEYGPIKVGRPWQPGDLFTKLSGEDHAELLKMGIAVEPRS